jgi:hypothetical protein
MNVNSAKTAVFSVRIIGVRHYYPILQEIGTVKIPILMGVSFLHYVRWGS